MITLVVSHEIHLKERPIGMPINENFEIVKVQIPELSDGEFLVRNIWMSVDPYMRGRMTERDYITIPDQTYVDPVSIISLNLID